MKQTSTAFLVPLADPCSWFAFPSNKEEISIPALVKSNVTSTTRSSATVVGTPRESQSREIRSLGRQKLSEPFLSKHLVHYSPSLMSAGLGLQSTVPNILSNPINGSAPSALMTTFPNGEIRFLAMLSENCIDLQEPWSEPKHEFRISVFSFRKTVYILFFLFFITIK